MNGSGCWKWCNNYHFASEEQIFSLNETFSTPLLEQYINDKGGFWFHSPEILIFSCPIFCPNNWCQMFFQLLFCVVVIPEFQQECTDWHISCEMGTYSVISCHILLCAWLKNNCWKTFPPTSSILSLYWNCFCHSLGWFLLFSAKLSFQSREKWVTG